MPDHDNRSKITLEDLLRLKRAERPSPEFWVGFERELRQKQLAALLERRPWWQGIPQFLSRRAYLPLGATAALAITLISVRYYPANQLARVEEPALAPVAGSRVVSLAASGLTKNPASVATLSAQREDTPRVDDRTAVAANLNLSEQLPERTAGLTPWTSPRPVDTPSARSIAATIANLEETHPELANFALGGRVPATSSVEESAIRTAELPDVQAVASKSSRLLAQFNDRRFTPEPQAPEVLRERLTRRMAYEDMNDRYSRVDLQANRVLVKF
ncbi:MAG: hypothetical protein ACHQ5A_05630 [Opitutales bacterium]